MRAEVTVDDVQGDNHVLGTRFPVALQRASSRTFAADRPFVRFDFSATLTSARQTSAGPAPATCTRRAGRARRARRMLHINAVQVSLAQ